MTEEEKTRLVEQYSRAEISAVDLRHALGNIGYADVIIELAKRDLPLPRASQVGREEQIAKAAAWLFPTDANLEALDRIMKRKAGGKAHPENILE
jgi:hypothetical protein